MPDVQQGPDLVSMAQQFSGLPMDDLIGGPLLAAAKANNQMAQSQVDFMLKTCFKPGAESGQPWEPIMANLKITRTGIGPTPVGDDGTPTGAPPETFDVPTTIRVPVLTIIPLNSLAVETVDITFEMEVKSSYSQDTEMSSQTQTHAEASLEASAGWGPFKVTIKGNVSRDTSNSSSDKQHYEKSNSAKYTVNVHAGQLPLPQGVQTIIEAYAKSIEPIQLTPPSS